MSGAVPPPAARPLERAARVPRPVCPGCGRCGRVDPAPAPQRAPLRAGVARCGGGGRASPGGVPSTVVRGAWCQALSLPRPPVLWSGQPGFRDPCVPGAVDAGVWTLHRPHSVRPCGPALLAVGVAEGRPRGGVSSAVVRGAWCQALSLPRPPVLWSGQPGFRYPCVPGAVGAGVWTLHRPHSVRPCGPALLAVGMAEGRPRGGFLPPLCGAPGVRRCPSPGRPSSGAGSPGSATRVSRVRSVRACGPCTGPTACALAGRRCSLWGWRKGVPGGGAFRRCVGRLVSGAVPPRAVPRWLGFVVCGLAVAWHLFVCRGSLRVVRALRVCGTRRPSLLGTCPCALVVAGGVPLWRASWPRVVRRASSGPVALGAPVGFPDAVVPFPTPGACAPGFTGRLRGARGGRPRTGLIVPAAGPRRGRGAGLGPRRTRSGPRDGVVPGGSLRRRSWAACAAVVGVWTRSLTRPVSRTVRRSTGDSAGAPGLFRVDADTSPCGSGAPRPGPVRVCVCVLFLAGSGGPASRARSGAPHLFLWPLCLSALLGPLRAGVALFSFAAVAVPRWLFFSASRCLARASFGSLAWPLAALWWLLPRPPPPLFCLAGFVALACGLGVFFFFFFFFLLLLPPPCAPVVSGFLWFPAPGCPGPRRLRFCVSRLSMRLSLFRAFRLAFGCSRVVAAPPPPPPLCPAVSVPAARCCVPCCAVRPWVRCCAALLRVVSPGVVLSCALLRSFGAAACCAVPSGAARRPRALCSAALCVAALCFAVFPRAVCSVLCVFCRGAVVRAVRSLCSPLCAVLCFAVLVRSRCAVRVVRAVAGAWCCGALLCVVLFPVVCRGAVLGLVARGCLLVACFGVGVPVWPPGLLPCGWCGLLWCPAFLCRVLWCCAVAWCCAVVLCCRVAVLLGLALPFCGLSCCCVVLLAGCAVFGPVVVSACCGALFLALCVPRLLRSVRCGALLCWLWCPASLCRVPWRCAVVWCCAVVLCCRFAVLFVFALPSCGVSCGACVVCAVVGASCCGVSLCVVVSPRAFCGVVVLLWCVVVSCCAVRCPVVSCALCRVLRCRAVLRCCAGWLCCAVVCAAGVCFALFSFAKNPCRFSVPLKTLFFFFFFFFKIK